MELRFNQGKALLSNAFYSDNFTMFVSRDIIVTSWMAITEDGW